MNKELSQDNSFYYINDKLLKMYYNQIMEKDKFIQLESINSFYEHLLQKTWQFHSRGIRQILFDDGRRPKSGGKQNAY